MTFILVRQKSGSLEAHISWELDIPITENINIETKILITTTSKMFQIAGFASSSIDDRLFNVVLGYDRDSRRLYNSIVNGLINVIFGRGKSLSRFIYISNRYYFKWITVKIYVDFTNKTVTVYIDDEQKVTASFENSKPWLRVLRIAVCGGNTSLLGMMFIDRIKIYSQTTMYLSVDFEDKTLGRGIIDDARTDIYFIYEPYIFDWSRATIRRLFMPVGPNGTNYYRDPTIIHDEKGFAVRVNGYFYMCPANHVVSDMDVTYRSKATLMRSRDLINWEIIADLSQYRNLKLNNYYPTRADLMYDRSKNKIYVLLELWDTHNKKYFTVYEAPNIEDPSTWTLVAGPSKTIYGGVPWLVRNPNTGKLEAWFEYRPKNTSDYVIAYMEVNECLRNFRDPIIHYDVREAGWHTPNPAVIYDNTKLILTNPVPTLRGVGNGLYCVIAVEVPGTDDIAILKSGTWNNPSLVRRHETSRLVATKSMLDSGNFWLMWWEGEFGSGAHAIMLMTYNKPSVNDVPNEIV